MGRGALQHRLPLSPVRPGGPVRAPHGPPPKGAAGPGSAAGGGDLEQWPGDAGGWRDGAPEVRSEEKSTCIPPCDSPSLLSLCFPLPSPLCKLAAHSPPKGA